MSLNDPSSSALSQPPMVIDLTDDADEIEEAHQSAIENDDLEEITAEQWSAVTQNVTRPAPGEIPKADGPSSNGEGTDKADVVVKVEAPSEHGPQSGSTVHIKTEASSDVIVKAENPSPSPEHGQARDGLSQTRPSHDVADFKIKEEPQSLPLPKSPVTPDGQRGSLFGGLQPLLRPTDNNMSQDGSNDMEKEVKIERGFSPIILDFEDSSRPDGYETSPSEKRFREKICTTSEEWWTRRHLHEAEKKKKYKTQAKRTFGVQGASAKVHSFMHHNPLAEHDSEPDLEPMPVVATSSRKEQLDQLLNNCPKYEGLHKCRGDKTSLKRAGESFGRGNIKTESATTSLLKGMKSGLYHHQLVGSSWMLGREFDPKGPTGGICADAMGVGKTVEMLAATQWQSEIRRHLADDVCPSIMVLKKSHRLSKEMVSTADIVVTTYAELRMSVPFPSAPILRKLLGKGQKRKHNEYENETEDEVEDTTPLEKWIQEQVEDGKGGVLHQVKWTRVVLDEAHSIKNFVCQTSLAATFLKGKYRWAMSGTPIMNSRSEMYAYFRFLKDPKTTSYEKFLKRFCDEKNLKRCNGNLDNALSRIVIRFASRTMRDKMFGRPLVDLPKKVTKSTKLDMDAPEKVLYRAIEAKFKQLGKEKMAEDDERKKFKCALLRLTLLRQYTGHPILIERAITDLFSVAELKEIQQKINDKKSAIHKRISIWMKHRRSSIKFAEFSKMVKREPCPMCRDVPQEPMKIVECGHIFCSTCIQEEIVEQQADDGREVGILRDYMSKVDRLKASSEILDEEISAVAHGRDFLKILPRPDMECKWLDDYDAGKANLPTSKKVEEVRTQLRQWRKDAPKDKIVIFAQWRIMLRLIGIMLKEENRDFLKNLQGDMNIDQRDKAVDVFEKNDEVNVFVAGLKAGSLGLNLAFANRAITIDPWFNECIEAQAFSRILRLGQKKETHFVRLLVKKTVDSRIRKLQKKKSKDINRTLQDKLTEEEYLSLFGRVITDEFGHFTVEDDYHDPDSESDSESENEAPMPPARTRGRGSKNNAAPATRTKGQIQFPSRRQKTSK
ncbi:hypothetical protein NHQ30_006584 [Ciborinia camelliae]|nr:hypothetical protein NHQ30_006584 [Ciborinia camelliae]